MEGAVCPSSELIILPLEYQYKNCSTKIAAIKNIGAGGVTSAHCQDCRGRNQIFFTKSNTLLHRNCYMPSIGYKINLWVGSVSYYHVSMRKYL